MQKLRKPIGFIAAVALATAGLVPLVGSSVFAHADPITAEYNGTTFTNDTQSKDRERRNESNNNGQFVNGDSSYLPESNPLTNTANDTTCLRTHDPHTPPYDRITYWQKNFMQSDPMNEAGCPTGPQAANVKELAYKTLNKLSSNVPDSVAAADAKFGWRSIADNGYVSAMRNFASNSPGNYKNDVNYFALGNFNGQSNGLVDTRKESYKGLYQDNAVKNGTVDPGIGQEMRFKATPASNITEVTSYPITGQLNYALWVKGNATAEDPYNGRTNMYWTPTTQGAQIGISGYNNSGGSYGMFENAVDSSSRGTTNQLDSGLLIALPQPKPKAEATNVAKGASLGHAEDFITNKDKVTADTTLISRYGITTPQIKQRQQFHTLTSKITTIRTHTNTP